MADISFYKYLEAAFRHKLFKDIKAASFNYLGFNLPYESMEGKKGIFEYARKVLPSFYSLHFADTEEGHLQMARDFLQKLDRHQDPELSKYFDPATAPEENEQIIQEAEIESTAPIGEPESYPPPSPIPVMPKKIIILNPQEESTQTEKEGATEMETQPAATGSVQTEPPQEAGMLPQPAGIPQPPSMSFSTGLGGSGAPPRKRGGKEEGKEKKRWFGRLRSSASSNLLDFLPVDKMARWLYQNAIKPLAQWLGRNVLQPLARLAAQTASRVLWPLVQRLALSALQGLLSVLGGIGGISLGGVAAGLALFAASALIWLTAIAIVILIVAVIWTGFKGFEGFKSPYGYGSLDYYVTALRNPNVAPHDIKTLIQESLPDPQVNNWQTIIDAAVANNWNPALLLTLWIIASGAQGKEGYLDPLGCNPNPQLPNQDLNKSLDCFFDKFKSYRDDTFSLQFLRDWVNYFNLESKDPKLFYDDIKKWYSQMIYEGELGEIVAATDDQSKTTGISGCPVIGTITNPYGYNLPDYPRKNIGCGVFANCHNGIDIEAAKGEGAPVVSIMKGSALAGNDPQNGLYVQVSETEFEQSTNENIIVFSHLSGYAPKFVANVQRIPVEKGEVIGFVGKSGEEIDNPHLHYKIFKGTTLINPFVFLPGSATIDPDVPIAESGTFFPELSKNNYAEIRHQPNSITNNWGTCDLLP